ncbi:hypothetical protein ACA910_004648 [Epithemia clementina (nom. ined.)]
MVNTTQLLVFTFTITSLLSSWLVSGLNDHVSVLDSSSVTLYSSSSSSSSANHRQLQSALVCPDQTPPGFGSTIAQVLEDEGYVLLVAALEATGLLATLDEEVDDVNGETLLTVFAPDDAAILAFTNNNVEQYLTDPTLRSALEGILRYHVVACGITSSALAALPATSFPLTVATLLQQEDGTTPATFQLVSNSNGLFLQGSGNDARDLPQIVRPDLTASNGFVHGINKVMDPSTPSIGLIALNNAAFSILASLLEQAELLSTLLDPNQSVTVFAPTDDAFNALGQDTLNALLADIPTLTNILLYHVLPGVTLSSDIAAAANPTLTVPTLLAATETLDVTYNAGAGTVTVQGSGNDSPSNVVTADILASNGVVHVIDQVLLLGTGGGDNGGDGGGEGDDDDDNGDNGGGGGEGDDDDDDDNNGGGTTGNSTTTENTIGSVAQNSGSFPTLVAALEAAGLLDAVNDPAATLTVFAPTEEAFAELPSATLDFLLANTDSLQTVLLYHVLPQIYRSSDIVNLRFNPTPFATATPDGQQVLVFNSPSVALQGLGNQGVSSAVTTTDIDASNGVIHVIDRVLIPLLPIASRIGMQGLSLLYAALEYTDLVDTLNAGGPYTIFAPNDAAFNAAGISGAADLEALGQSTVTTILTQHVLDPSVYLGSVSAHTLLEFAALTTANGLPIRLLTLAGDDLVATADLSSPSTVFLRAPGNTDEANLPTLVTAEADLAGLNGVVHVIDGVLLPAS